MDRSDQPAAFRGAIGNGRSRMTALAVIAVVGLLVGLGWLAGFADDAGPIPSPLPSGSPPVAAASPTPRPSRAATPRPSPTPTPTPAPTLAPFAAPPTTAELARTGVQVAGIGDPSVGSVVPDADGTVWISRAGGVARVDPRTGRGREWTLADDAAFAAGSLASAQEGGVWLVGPDAIRLFDGERFRAVVETPASVWTVVEAPDGSIWGVGDPIGVIRWSNGVWTSDPPGRPARGASGLVLDAEGRIWVSNYETTAAGNWTGRGISMWDGQSWTTYDDEDLPLGPGSQSTVVAGADGGVWATADHRLARFEAGRWTEVEVPDRPPSTYFTAIDADGRLWFAGEGCETCGVTLHVYDGSSWTAYDGEDGLPGPEEVGWGWSGLTIGPGWVLATTEVGPYRLAGETWHPVELPEPPGPSPASSDVPRAIGTLAAVSRTEVWAATRLDNPSAPLAGDGALFRFDGTTWHRERLPVETVVRQLVVAPDGALWATTDAGPLVRRDGRWIDLGSTVARVVPRPDQVVNVCGAAVFVSADGVAYYVGARSANRVVALLPTATGWEPSLHSAPSVQPECPSELAVTADGTVWILQRGWGTMLSRSAGDTWEQVSIPTAGLPGEQGSPTGITVDRDGSLWAVVTTWSSTGTTASTDVLELVGDEWVRRGGSPGPDYVQGLAQLPDGSLIAVGNGVARFDGERWHRWLENLWLERVSVAPDGTVWVAGPNVYRLPPSMP